MELRDPMLAPRSTRGGARASRSPFCAPAATLSLLALAALFLTSTWLSQKLGGAADHRRGAPSSEEGAGDVGAATDGASVGVSTFSTPTFDDTHGVNDAGDDAPKGGGGSSAGADDGEGAGGLSGFEGEKTSIDGATRQEGNDRPSGRADTEDDARVDGAEIPTTTSTCGDGRCEPPETAETCMADCPGVTTPAMCGEEPHSDPGGYAVVWGAGHVKASASECCDACAAHAADPKNRERPCNSWVFCHTLPYCWSLDTGNHHGYGECWLKHQTDPTRPLYGQRGKFTEEFRRQHADAHKTGKMPDGTPRNLSVPTHVPWTGGIMGAVVDLGVRWETGLDGMHSSTGASEVQWRAWESREENLARGVKPESMPA